MAKTSMIVKQEKAKRAYLHRLNLGLEPKPAQSVRFYNRCAQCGRPHGYMRRFDMCRICFRELARAGKIAGLKKSSW